MIRIALSEELLDLHEDWFWDVILPDVKIRINK